MSLNTNNQRVSFASVKSQFPYPDFLEVQLKSFRDFFQLDTATEHRKNEGMYKVFAENFPIADTRNNFVLEFLDYYIEPPRYTIEECLRRGLTYSVPLKAKLKLYCTDPDHEDFDTVIQDVYLGPIPYMTDKGTFVINGAERVIVSQLHRSPGVFFGQSVHTNGTKLYSARIIPFRGSWIEFATDINNVMYAYIDRKKKLPVTTLLRAIGFESDKDILETFARRGMAREYRVAQMLSSSTLYLSDLERVMTICRGEFRSNADGASLEYGAHGWWGCKSGEEWIIAPLYSGGFEPSEGLVLLELGGYRHFVSMEDGGVVASFESATNVGPLRGGSTRIRLADSTERVITREELINSPKNNIFVR